MKKIVLNFMIISILLSFGACDYLDVVPDNVATLDNAFTDKYNAEKFLFTCYSYLPKMGDINQNPALLGSDEMSLGKYHESNIGVQLANGYQTTVNPLFDYWRGYNMYVGIRDCNIFLERINEVPDISDYEKNIWIAEVKFIKAYLHFYLLRMYGPIHIVRENLSITESIDNLKLSRDPVDDCFDYVVHLLDEAIEELPDNVQSDITHLGHITKTIAMGIKAKVLVTRASPLYNGQLGLQLTNKDGTKLFPQQDETVIAQKWMDAAEACEEAIIQADKMGYRLLGISDFDESGATVSDTTKLKTILRYRVTKRDNDEVIWTHTNSEVSAGGLQSWSIPAYYTVQDWRGDGRLGVPLKISLMHYTNNGVPIEEDKTWQDVSLNRISVAPAGHQYYIKNGYRTVARNFNREPRYYSDLTFDGALIYGHQRVYKTDNNSELDYINHKQGGHSSSGYAYKFSPFGYWPVKLVNISTGQSNFGWGGINYGFPALRLADLYLLFAESLIETNKLDEAKIWIDKVRERAGLLSVNEAWKKFSKNPSKPNTKEGMREILHRERLIEMAFEGSRFWDLRRWLKAEDECNIPVSTWNPLESTVEGYYSMQILYYPTFYVKHYFFPLAEDELNKNPNLVQNYGW